MVSAGGCSSRPWPVSLRSSPGSRLSTSYVVLRLGRVGTFVDLDRSNGLPDLISTLALLAAVGGAVLLAQRCDARRRREAWALAALLAALALADALHDGPHASAGGGWYVIALVVATGVLLAHVGLESNVRSRTTLGVAAVILIASFLVNGLDRARSVVRTGTRRSDRRVPDRREGGPRAPRLVARRARVVGRGAPSAPRPDRRLQRELLEHRLHRDDMPLEAELRVRQAGCDADQLREVKDRHLEVLPGLLLELRLPRVE